MKIDEVIKSGISRAGVIRVRTAINPLLWASLISSPICWTFAYVFRQDEVLRYSFFALGALPVIGTFIAYFLLLFRDPDRLQSEGFILKQQELSIIDRKGVPPLIDEIILDDDSFIAEAYAKVIPEQAEKP